VPRLKTVAIEGTILSVCNDCSRFGDEVSTPVVRRSTMPPIIAQRLEARKRRMTPKDVYEQTGELEFAEDFPQRIRTAREARGWKQSDLGAKINEKASVIAKLESGTMTPGDGLVRKLENAAALKTEMEKWSVNYTAEEILEQTGFEEIALLSLSSSDYTHAKALVRAIADKLGDKNLSISLLLVRLVNRELGSAG